jgi:5-methylcytosine-specific restriction endonuclease McrA
MNSEQRNNIFIRDQFLCQCCGKHIGAYDTPQAAHRIRQGKQAEKHIMSYLWNKYQKDRSRAWVRKYIINNEKNLVSTCSLKCNSSFNIFTMSVKRDALIDLIIEEDQLFSLNTPDK